MSSTDRRTDGQTDKVNPVYPPSNFVGRGYKNVKMSQPHHKFKKQSVHNTVESESDNSGDETFHIFHTSDSNHDSESECLNFEINGQNISFIPDTGSQVTILPETAYDKLKEHWPTLQKCTRPVYSYMSSEPLNIRGQF